MPNFLPSRGRPGVVIAMTVDRRLTPADFIAAATVPTSRLLGPGVIQHIKSIHHRAAQLVADGRSRKEVAMLIGYTPQRVGDLMADPAFSELVIGYRSQIAELTVAESARMQAKLLDIGETVVNEIQDRLDDDARRREIPIGELRQLASVALDRTVAPPKSAPPNTTAPLHVTFNIGTRDLRPKDVEITQTLENENEPISE